MNLLGFGVKRWKVKVTLSRRRFQVYLVLNCDWLLWAAVIASDDENDAESILPELSDDDEVENNRRHKEWVTLTALWNCCTRGVQSFWPAGQVYKFQAGWGPDRDAEGIEGERNGEGIEGGREWRGGVPLPSRLRWLGERRKLPQRVLGWSPGRKRVLAYFRAWKNTPNRHKSIIVDVFGRPRGPDRAHSRMLDLVGRIEPTAVCWTLLC